MERTRQRASLALIIVEFFLTCHMKHAITLSYSYGWRHFFRRGFDATTERLPSNAK